MRLVLFNKSKITKLILPDKVEGSFWLVDELNKDHNIINIESENGNWVLKENPDAKILYDNSYVSHLELDINITCVIEYNNEKMFLIAEKIYDDSLNYYTIPENKEITLGNSSGNIIFDNSNLFNDYMKLTFLGDGKWKIAIQQQSKIYINNFLLKYYSKIINVGDTIYIYGLRIGLYNGMLSINNALGSVILDSTFIPKKYEKIEVDESKIPSGDDIKEIDLYTEDDYFYKKPRMRRFIEEQDFPLASPPGSSKTEEMPIFLVLGPTITMAITTTVTTINTIINIFVQKKSIVSQIPNLITALATLLGSILWPFLTRRYQKKLEKRREKKRRTKYSEYISKKRKEIYDITIEQTQILKENLISLDECYNIILRKKRELWERSITQQDFLVVRLGIGNVPLKVKISYTEEEFSMEDDDLKDMVKKFVNETKDINNVPVGFSFYDKRVVAIMGKGGETSYFLDNILLQLIAFHSYDDLKIVFLTNKKHKDIWEKYKELPHCFSNNKNIRFFATDIEDVKQVSSYLEQEYIKRATQKEQTQAVKKEDQKSQNVVFAPHYLIITDDYPMIRNIGIVNLILKNDVNMGFGLVCVENKLGKLPSECTNFISIAGNKGTIITTDLNNYTNQDFEKEINTSFNMNLCCDTLANIPIEFLENIRSLPDTMGFLEMYNVGKVEHLNSLNRWKINNPVVSLRAQVGVNDESNPIYLDLHEKFHGPHGLIAGTTGSGKSEFLITYILSMVVNYSPNEVAFILIDYKGGGLAGAFEKKNQGLKLPHLAGTITNLDKASLNRTLVSINSELKRRQVIFNEAREKLGESTIDIYKYQNFFREGKLDKPMPHLFIISDEFAELRSQQPEFMADLISAARIGRALGVHLILATQKPSGVVSDEIWANSKFKVCLKVQNSGDSSEMIKTPDAAQLTNPGRFYLLVGNNEIYVLGQSGWAGTRYKPSPTVKANYDRSITVIDEIGNTVKNISDTVVVRQTEDLGDELLNVLQYIIKVAETENIKVDSLWLDNIPDKIYVDDLIQKYSFNDNGIVTAIIGEYDNPEIQKQGLLSLPLDDEGNSLFYGSSGTDREMIFTSILYSLCTRYTAKDINIYIIDCGSESFGMFSNFPQVGDIAVSSERDKIIKLFELLQYEMEKRKKMFSNYNGNYNTYCKNSGNKIPLEIIMINNFDTFKESYDNLVDTIVYLCREGGRYGIIFLINGNRCRSVNYSISVNFYHNYVTTMTDRNEYVDILGRIGNLYPAEFEGRGIFKDGVALEFQTASIYDGDSLFDFIKEKAASMIAKDPTKAPAIPVLPDEVKLENLEKYMDNIDKIPLGISKNRLEVVSYNFFKENANIIASKSIKNVIDILKTIITGVRKTKNFTVLIDTEQQLSEIGGIVDTYVDKNFEEFILSFEQFLDKEVEGKSIKLLCIIAGLERFQGSINSQKFNGFFNGIKTFDNVSLVFVDSSHKLKKVAFESWYLDSINKSNGIWIGPGFAEQAVITLEGSYKVVNQDDTRFAYIVKDGEYELIKTIGGASRKNEE